MPLRAFIGGDEIISSFLSTDEWTALTIKIKTNKLDVIIAQTGKGGYLRTSKLGFHHFVHSKGQVPEDWKPESIQHLIAKSQILLGCKEAGWDAKPEFSEANWIADVVAFNGKHRIAFEVQWSQQSLEITQERQKKYKESDVRGCWFFRKLPKVYDYWGTGSIVDNNSYVDKKIPAFKIRENETNQMMVEINENTYDLKIFVADLLNKQYRCCENYTSELVQEVDIVFWQKVCKYCETPQHIYSITPRFKSICGKDLNSGKFTCDKSIIEFHPSIVKCVNDILKSSEGGIIKMGAVKQRKYNRKDVQEYISFGCYLCDNIIDYELLNLELVREWLPSNWILFNKTITFSPPIKQKGKHWCRRTDNRFCES